MRFVRTANDDRGQSYVAEEIEVSGDALTNLLELDGVASVVPAGGEGELDLGVNPGSARWMIIRMGPDQSYPMHWTRTVDLDLVLEGSIDLVLDRGSVTLSAGDTALVTGRHAWEPGPDGALMSIVLLGVGRGPEAVDDTGESG